MKNNIRIIKTGNYDDFSKKAANIIAGHVNLRENTVLGMATGSTPEGAYENLVRMHENGDLDFSGVSTINLDEYVDLPAEHSQSYRHYMDEKFFCKININKQNTYLPDGMAKNLEEECDEYEKLISDLGGIDFQILGIGTNGHIGFNEPDDHFSKKTIHTELAPATVEANARFFKSKEEVPKSAISMGIGTIFRANQILLLASGISKAQIIKDALFGEITPKVPASILQLHKNCIVILDKEAASLI